MLALSLVVLLTVSDIDGGSSSPRVAPDPATADTNPAPFGPLSDTSLIREDLDPSVKMLESDNLELRFGSFLQVHSAFYAGSDALVSNGDPASEPGFRLRRARIGLEGRLAQRAGIFLNINLLENDTEVGTVADAKLAYSFAPWLGVALGTSKVAFSRGALLSARNLVGIERPRSVSEISPSRRLGLTVEGSVLEGKFGYVASLMNGTEGFTAGNQFGGYLAAARIEVTPWGTPDNARPGVSGIGVGVSAVHDDGPSVNRDAVSFDVIGAYRGASLLLEALCDESTPSSGLFFPTTVGPVVNAKTQRCGAYAEAAYAFLVREYPLQLTARAELYDDNRRLQDAGDQLFISGGVNVNPLPYLRVQLQYFMRRERSGVERANDVLVASLQGAF